MSFYRLRSGSQCPPREALRIIVTAAIACQYRRIVISLYEFAAGGHVAMYFKRDVHDSYNVKVDASNARMVWSHEGMIHP
jgi:hypothetical protein